MNNIVEEFHGRYPWRVRIVHDTEAPRPDETLMPPTFFVSIPDANVWYASEDEPVPVERITEAVKRFDPAHRELRDLYLDRHLITRWLRMFHGATRVDFWATAWMVYVAFDSPQWRDRNGIGVGDALGDLTRPMRDHQAWQQGQSYRIVVEKRRRGRTEWHDTGETTPVEVWTEAETLEKVYGLVNAQKVARVMLSQHDKPIRDVAERFIPEAETQTQILGSGFDAYPWWIRLESKTEQAEGWVCEVECLDETEKSTLVKSVDHASLIRVMRLIADGGGEGVGQKTRRECRELLADNGIRYEEVAGFDAESADEVMQVAVLGKVVFG